MQDEEISDGNSPDSVNTGVLIDKYHTSVYRYAFRLSGRQSDAEDITQQTYLIAHQKIGQLKKPSSARSWLLTIARNCFLKRLKIKTAVPASSIDVDVQQVEQKSGSEEKSALSTIGSNAVQAAISELDDHHRLVVMMFYFEKLSYKEIAEQLDVAVGTVMSRLSRAKIKLHKLLAGQQQESERISG